MNYAGMRSLPLVANGFTSDIVIVSLFEASRRLSILGQLPPGLAESYFLKKYRHRAKCSIENLTLGAKNEL
jgi:hypothetical protein